MTRWEHWALGIFAVLVLLSGGGALRQFYLDSTVIVPSSGGTYIEGSVGELQPLNPWFTVQNDVNRDIISLVFAGLLRYNPQSRKIEDDLATMLVSADNKTYTLTLKEKIFWQDSTEKDPHPVTTDDVVFTFKTIQDPQFPNLLLQQNFRGVKVEKIDERVVRFTLEEPYGFFPSNLTLGLLPAKSFEGVPPGKMDQQLDFAFAPIGAGPYKIRNIVQTDLSSEVTLERFRRDLPPVYRLDRIVFRIFPDYSSLLSDLRNLQGVRLVPKNDKGEPIIPRRFQARTYYLPQYVALFLNLDQQKLKDQKLRIGLQLGTNKKAITDAIHESVIVDTPLLEIDVSDWRYQFDPDAAQGALLASRWNIPERLRLQKILEQEEANRTGIVPAPTVAVINAAVGLTLSGSYTDMPRGARINGIALSDGPSGSGSWMMTLPLGTGTGALQSGENLVRVTDETGKVIDSFYLFVPKDPAEAARALEERRVSRQFVDTRTGVAQSGAQVAIGNIFLDNGMLRLRRPEDPPTVRVNEKGEPLTLRLLTSSAPPAYKLVAEEVARQWSALGVKVEVQVPATRDEFEKRLLKRDYDVLLFGQSLLDNLDSYPYWHSSGVQKVAGGEKDLRRDAYNLSQYVSFSADQLLERVRRTSDEADRKKALGELRNILKTDVPAIFLYSPLYTYAHHQNIQGIELGSLSLHSDRFLTLYKWYINEDRIFKPGMSWFSFFGWVGSLFRGS